MTALLNPPAQTSQYKMTVVIQPTTPEFPSLQSTKEELTKIEENVPRQWLTSLGQTSPAMVDSALIHLQESSVVHFFCHGIQDMKSPLESGLLLTDDRLKVSRLMQGNDNL